MSRVMIVLEDAPDGSVNFEWRADPPVPARGRGLRTPAQLAAMVAINALREGQPK